MAQWIGAWLGYFRRLWGRGFLVLLVAGIIAVFLGLAAFAVISAIGWLLGWSDASAWDWFKLSSLLWLPVAAGTVINSAKFGRLDSPPSWPDHRLGLPLPEYDPDRI